MTSTGSAVITCDQTSFIIPNDPTRLDLLRKLPLRRWSSTLDGWLVPRVQEVYDLLLELGFKVKHLERPTDKAYRIGVDPSERFLLVKTLGTAEDAEYCKKIPEFRRYDGVLRGWVCKATTKNVDYLTLVFPAAQWTPRAKALIKAPAEQPLAMPADFKFKTKPFAHQLKDFHRSRDREFYALFWQQGTGKTKAFIDTFAWNAQHGKVEALLVVCPNAVKSTWEEDELPAHTPEWLETDVCIWDVKTKRGIDFWIHTRPKNAVKILVMNVEALSHVSGVKAATLLVSKYRTMMVIDESSVISNPKASRTKAAIKIGEKCPIRRVGDGTPADESPMQFFAQGRFLSPSIFGTNFYSYRNKYALMGGWQGKQIIGYANLEELQLILDEHSSRVLKTEAFDLPEQLFERRQVELTLEQLRMYNELRDELLTETRQGIIEVQHAITKLLRLHQIVGGFMPATMFTTDPETGDVEPVHYKTPPAIPGGNPKLDALLDIIQQAGKEKIIVYCRFRPEMDLITKTLRERYGEKSTVEMRGGMTTAGRNESKRRFQKEDAQFMVAQSRAAGRGLTLTACHTVVYFSNDFSLTVRSQSQDRVHRYGQQHPVTYIDLVAKNCSLDLHVIKTLKKKKSLAETVLGDPTLSWL